MDAVAPARLRRDRAGNRESHATRIRHGAVTAVSLMPEGEHTQASGSFGGIVRGRRSRVVLTPGVLASSLGGDAAAQPGTRISHPQGDGGNSATLPEESTKDTVKTIRAGKAGRPATPVVHPVCISIAHDCGCRRRPAFPVPFGNLGARRQQSSGEIRRENARICLQ